VYAFSSEINCFVKCYTLPIVRMGRRALPKFDPRIDLSRHFKLFDDLPRPWDGEKLFGRSAPLEVEVGSGKGLFLTSAATTRPDTNFLGIELAPRYARFAAARLAKLNVPNAVMIGGDALRVMHEVLPTSGIAAVHVYFPDPWWKKRHRKRRVMCEALLEDVVRVLEPGGRLHFWTDVQEYFQTSLELIAAHAALVGPLPVTERPAEHTLDYRTHFERRTRLAGEKVYRAEFVNS
jgi:tRNA (guanine-N7-)-methyltransferase